MTNKSMAIKAENISKCYRIGVKETMHDSLSGAMMDFLKKPMQNYKKYKALYTFKDAKEMEGEPADVIWALKDVSFVVRRGETMGIVGRNGAGKSTILKILSRITDPTEGRVEVRGKISSLLEVGTGFHPELTGRENVYLNGTILGMKKREIDQGFAEIVNFSGIGKFIDTPVKRYSSGMKVRLAFSVAAHMDPDILIIDEVLAVGDDEFQRKCLDKMGDVAAKGRTVVFVSHDMGAINRLCEKAIWIDDGCIREVGESSEIINHYLSHQSSLNGEMDLTEIVNKYRVGPVYAQKAFTKDSSGKVKSQFIMGEDIVFEFDIFSEEYMEKVSMALVLKTITGIRVLHMVGINSGFLVDELHGNKRIKVTIPKIPLYPGSYTFSIWIGDTIGHQYDYVKDCIAIDIIDSGCVASGHVLSWKYALFSHPTDWEETLMD